MLSFFSFDMFCYFVKNHVEQVAFDRLVLIKNIEAQGHVHVVHGQVETMDTQRLEDPGFQVLCFNHVAVLSM